VTLITRDLVDAAISLRVAMDSVRTQAIEEWDRKEQEARARLVKRLSQPVPLPVKDSPEIVRLMEDRRNARAQMHKAEASLANFQTQGRIEVERTINVPDTQTVLPFFSALGGNGDGDLPRPKELGGGFDLLLDAFPGPPDIRLMDLDALQTVVDSFPFELPLTASKPFGKLVPPLQSAVQGKPAEILATAKMLLRENQYRAAFQYVYDLRQKSPDATSLFYTGLSAYMASRLQARDGETAKSGENLDLAIGHFKTASKFATADQQKLLALLTETLESVKQRDGLLAAAAAPGNNLDRAQKLETAWKLFPAREDIGLQAAKAWQSAGQYGKCAAVASTLLASARDPEAARTCAALLTSARQQVEVTTKLKIGELIH
jgi:hypothetical protein